MQTVGEILKKTRLRKKLTLKKITEGTKIREEYLAALEENRYQDLPSMAYTQGFIKNYSRFLGLKHQSLLAIFRRDYKDQTKAGFNLTNTHDFCWTPRLTFISLFILGLVFFFGYLFWQYHLLLKSRFRP